MKVNLFGPKLFGIGIGPRTWQGLLVIAVYVASQMNWDELAEGFGWC